VLGIELGESSGNRSDVGARLAVGLLEQPATDDLERLLLRGGPPLAGHPTYHVLPPLQRGLAPRAADLQCRPAAFGIAPVRGRNGNHEQWLSPGGAGSACLNGCPDIWELESGDFAVIGIERTGELTPHLPPTASCGLDERIVVVLRAILVNARNDIPAA
jgi:hypothetical protein